MNHVVQPNVPKYETVKMQVYFDTHFPAQGILFSMLIFNFVNFNYFLIADFLHKEKVTRVQKCSHILRDITENKRISVQNYESKIREF